MHCRYCAGENQDEDEPVELVEQLKGITGEYLTYYYPEKFEDTYEWAYWPSSTIPLFEAKQTVRYTHVESGFVIEVHRCFEKKKRFFKATGPAPESAAEIRTFKRFFDQAITEEEKRGRNRRKDVTIEDIFAAMRSAPDAGQTRLALDLGISVDTLQARLKAAGWTWKKAKAAMKK